VYPARVLGFRTQRFVTAPEGAPAHFPEEIECGPGAFSGATLVSRWRPDPPPDLLPEMGSPDFVVCGCGSVVRARVHTAVPRTHRCPHREKCVGRPLCPECLISFDAIESIATEGTELEGTGTDERFNYIATFTSAQKTVSLIILTRRELNAVDRDLPRWRAETESIVKHKFEAWQLDRWRPPGSFTLNG
jgi:hypothetical protein